MGQFNPFENSGNEDIDTTAYATDISMSIDSKTYIMYTHLKNEAGDVIGKEQKIDLPLETMVVGGSYDDATKKVILTLKNGNTVDFSVADLVDGLQSEITENNKLSADLVDDTSTTNKFVTSAEKTKISNALTEEVYNAGKTIVKGTTFVLYDTTFTVGDNAETFNNYTSNKVAGSYSHAEGDSTRAIGNTSHAEGASTIARGTCSHAEGSGSVASGNYSHSEGGDTIARGSHSHAEGKSTTASGGYSHAEGEGTIASGEYSHAEGGGTIATSDYQHVQGKYNIEDSNSKYAFIIGNGTDNNNRSNVFAVDWNGKIYVGNSSTGVDVSQLLTEETYNAGKTIPKGTTYIIDGTTYTVGDNAEIFNKYSNNKAIGNYSHAEGGFTTAIGYGSHAEGGAAIASGDFSHAEGNGAKANGPYSHAEGLGSIARGYCQHVQGKYNIEESNGKYAFIIGNGNATNNRSNAFAVDWNGKIYVNNSETGVNVSEINNKLNNHDSALIDLIDSGQKNLASVNSGTFTAPTTPDGARFISIPVTGVSGDVVLYTGSLESDDTTVTTCGLRLQFADGTTQTIQINRGNNIVTNISLSGELDEIGIYPANGYTASEGKSLSFQNLMLCSKAAWDISQKYVPYRPSYDELVVRITSIENNLSNINAVLEEVL